MKNIFLFLFIIGFNYFSAVSGQDQTNRDPSGAYSGFIWKTTIHESTFYLAGSVHAGNEECFPLPDDFMECYEQADVMIMEVEEDFDTLEQLMLDYAEKDRQSEDLYFRHHLDSATIQQILKVLDKEEFLKYDQYKGWFLNMTLSGTRLKLVGFDPDYGIDMFFRKKASADMKMVIGLDRFEDQLKLFEFDVPHEAQVRIIEQTAASMEMQARAEAPLMTSYFAWDPEAFEGTFLSMYDFENPTIKNVYDLVFTARNKSWVEKLEKIALDAPGTYMVLVGAGHLFGPGNLRELLERNGHVIEPLR